MAPITITLPNNIGELNYYKRDYKILQKIKKLGNKDLLDEFLDIANETSFYLPFMHRAVDNDYYERFKFLLDCNEDPNEEEQEYYQFPIACLKYKDGSITY